MEKEAGLGKWSKEALQSPERQNSGHQKAARYIWMWWSDMHLVAVIILLDVAAVCRCMLIIIVLT